MRWPVVLPLVVGLLSVAPAPPARSQANDPAKKVVEAAVEQTRYTIHYDPSYTNLVYPGGDVPLDRGVCTDVIVRAFRKVGIDLQKEIHEDMQRNWPAYPKLWGLTRPDPNIDHRRVPNQMTYFGRRCASLPMTKQAMDYLPGDVVAWRLPSGWLHIGIVGSGVSVGGNPYVVHNLGAGTKLEDVLFVRPVIGHYRCFEAPR